MEEQLTYEEIQDFFERTLKLTTPPVAVKFVMSEEKKPIGVKRNVRPITFYQAVTIARQGEVLDSSVKNFSQLRISLLTDFDIMYTILKK